MPSTPLTQTCKTQPWKSHWPPAAQATSPEVEYGVEKGSIVVVDGTSAKAAAPASEKMMGKEDNIAERAVAEKQCRQWH